MFDNRIRAALGRAARFLPIVGVLRGYRRADLPHDLAAGLVLAVVTVPQALAYAFLAGLPAEAGLYASLAPMLAYALLSASRQVVVGPVAIAALMVAATLGEYAEAFSERYGAIALVVSLEAGLMLWLLRAARFGGIVNLLSHPVIGGFVNAAAVLIIASQLAPLAGIEAAFAGGAPFDLVELAGRAAQIDPVALALGAGALAALFALPPLLARCLPAARAARGLAPMLVAAAATAAVALLDLDVYTVGFVPPGLPLPTFPQVEFAMWWQLAPNAALIALVAYVESYSIGATLASRRRERVDGNRELVALGAANLAAGLSGGYPVAGSFTRSGVNAAAGARTPVSVLACTLAVALTLLWLTPAFAHLPHAALAAIVIASVWRLIDFRPLARHWRFYRPDAVTHAATFAAVLAAGAAAGLVFGIAVAIVLFMRGSSRPHIAVLGRLGDTPHFRNVERFATRTWPHLVAARVDESLYFANALQIEDRLLRLAAPAAVQHLLLVMSAVNFIDSTGLAMLERVSQRLAGAGVALHLCEVKGPVRDQLRHAAPGGWLAGSVFATTEAAFDALAGGIGSAGNAQSRVCE